VRYIAALIHTWMNSGKQFGGGSHKVNMKNKPKGAMRNIVVHYSSISEHFSFYQNIGNDRTQQPRARQIG
jgi:hypothetical protein